MASTREFKSFILEQLDLLNNITIRTMMGEYLIYYNGILFGGIYDDRLLIKIVDENKKYNLIENIPYDGGRPMYLIEDVDDKEKLKRIILDTCEGLSRK